MTDLKFAFRQLLKNPGFTAVAVLTLALGMGASVSIFSWLSAIILRPLPFHDADRLVLLSEKWSEKGWGRSAVSLGTFVDWREQATSFDSMAAFEELPLRMRSSQGDVVLRSLRASLTLFEVLKVHPRLGRGFLHHEGQPGGGHSVVLSHDLWKGQFGSRSDVIGASVELDGAPATIVGVMPEGFLFPYDTQIWTPLVADPQELDRRERRSLRVVGRLKTDVPRNAAEAELSGIMSRIAERFPSTNRGWDSVLEPLRVLYVGTDLRRTFSVLLGAAALVLLAACANIANLLLARFEARQREIAIRLSLGAGRGRIVRQVLTESLLLSVMGAVGALVLSLWLSSAISFLIPAYTLGGIRPTLDARVLFFSLGLCLSACLIFGSVPARLLARSSSVAGLARIGMFQNRVGPRRWQNRWVVCQVTSAVALMVGAGLMIHTMARLTRVNLGFDPRGVLVASVNPVWDAREPAYSPRKALYFERLQSDLARGPGIIDAAVFRDNGWSDCLPEGAPEPMRVFIAGCSTNLFRTLGVPLVRGGLFPELWKRGDPIEVVVNETLARRFWPGQDPIGKRFRPVEPPAAMWITVVGVVRDFQLSRDQEARPVYFTSYRWSYLDAVQMVFKADTPAAPTVATARRIIGRLDPDQSNCEIRTMNDALGDVLSARYRQLVLQGGFAGVALLLATVGIYGVVSCVMAQRKREVGIRVALGALPSDIFSLVLRQGLTPVLIGIGCGVLLSSGLSRLFASQMFGIKDAGPVIFAGVSTVMLLAGVLACLGPALRAMRSDPMEALRSE